MIDPNIALHIKTPNIVGPLDNYSKLAELAQTQAQTNTVNAALPYVGRLAEAKIKNLNQEQSSSTRLDEQWRHTENRQDVQMFLNWKVDDGIKAQSYQQLLNTLESRVPGGKKFAPAQWGPDAANYLKAVLYGAETANASATRVDTQAAAKPAVTAPSYTAQSAPVETPMPEDERAATIMADGDQAEKEDILARSDIAKAQAGEELTAPPVEVTAQAPVETSDDLRKKAIAADQEAATQKAYGTTVGNKNAVQAKKDAVNYRTAADRMDRMANQEQARQDRLSAWQEKQKEKNDLDMPPDVAKFAAQQYLAGDRTVLVGIARNQRAQITLRTAIVKEARAMGRTPQEMAAVIAEFDGIKAGERALGTRQAQVGVAVEEARNMAPLALAASENVNRSQYPLLNKIILAAEQGTGDENVVRFGIAVNSLINIYARAVNPTGVATVSDKDHARELLSTAWSKGQFRNGIDQLEKEMEAAYKAPGQVRSELRRAVTGEPEPVKAKPAESTTGPKSGEVIDGYKFKGGNPADKNNWEKQ